MNDLPGDTGRRSLPHFPPHTRGNDSVIIFLTVCTKDRKPLLANEEAHSLLREAWATADRWLVGRYVILPDHIHLFCAPREDANALGTWVRYWKSLVARGGPGEGNLWQKGYWDTQLRTGENHAAKWEYVQNNPVRHGLVSATEDWPYQGEMNEFILLS